MQGKSLNAGGAFYIDVINNIVVVELVDYNEGEIDKFKSTIMDSPLITFKQGEKYTMTANINAGGPISSIGCSVGYRARKTSTGQGFVTAGHCVRYLAIGTNIPGFGVLKNRQMQGSIDAAWIDSSSATGTPTNDFHLYSGSTVPSGTLSTSVATSYSIATIGQIVGRIGATTKHQTGVIGAINATVFVEDPPTQSCVMYTD